jgi:hypothetical protein
MSNFDLIIQYLERKKPKITYGSDVPTKPKWNISCDGNLLCADYHYYWMTVTYRPFKQNPYEVYIELANCGTRDGCDLYTKTWQDWWHDQRDVIEYIRYKLK